MRAEGYSKVDCIKATASVVRVGPVYTPPGHRRYGYATSLIAALSSELRRRGNRCILYTDLANPPRTRSTALSDRAVSEALRYRFDPPVTSGGELAGYRRPRH